ncbi:UNVERIFIED_CONTAM: hypothetical protein GTU68_012336, partial [Idotea baltica]|nr:hypothetical protein [Idotea baltica]
LTLLFFSALGQEFASQCPEPNGFFADAVQCDKYYACEDNVLTEKLCSDGMVFDDFNPAVEKCDFPFHISCEGRPELQPAQSSRTCPRLNGYFPHEDTSNCNQFYYCHGGTGSQVSCPESLVFSLKTGNCVWADEAGRSDCLAKNVLNFTCPKEEFEVAVAHPRYADPDDCQYFYVCINGENPRRNGCKFGEVFNSETKSCDAPINVPDCQDYYKEYFEQYFGTLGTGLASIPTPDVLAAAIGSGFALPEKAKRVRLNPGVNSHNPQAINPPRRRRPTETSPSRTAASAPTQTEPVASRAPAPAAAPAPRAPAPRAPAAAAPSAPRRPVTTPAPTTTPAPEELVYDDYYYYEDEVPAAAPA